MSDAYKLRKRALKHIENELPTARELVAKFDRIYVQPVNEKHLERQRSKWQAQELESQKVQIIFVDILSPDEFRQKVGL